ncbi:MAG TPA: DUF4238 domain-containing protein [Candidatus Angelobacter sp.]|nr:DUF4238 domain-containing protein [Candidatus Angelobacter sp.]
MAKAPTRRVEVKERPFRAAKRTEEKALSARRRPVRSEAERAKNALHATLIIMSAGDTKTPSVSDTANTNQHYVPQMLQRGFTTTKDSEQVWVFDKRTGNAFISGIRNIAAERGYYDLGGSAILDAAMNRADDLAARIINRIRDRSSLAGVTLDDRGMLAGIVVMQLLRTRGHQEHTRHVAQMLLKKLTEMSDGISPAMEAEFSEQQLREEYLGRIPKFTGDFLPHLLNKDLMLFGTNRNVPFCISDNPVALNNMLNPGDGIRGTLGLAVPGIEIYLPISSELTLAYMCPSVGQQYEEIRNKLWRLGGIYQGRCLHFPSSAGHRKTLGSET